MSQKLCPVTFFGGQSREFDLICLLCCLEMISLGGIVIDSNSGALFKNFNFGFLSVDFFVEWFGAELFDA
jgi:hypothetical protein